MLPCVLSVLGDFGYVASDVPSVRIIESIVVSGDRVIRILLEIWFAFELVGCTVCMFMFDFLVLVVNR